MSNVLALGTYEFDLSTEQRLIAADYLEERGERLEEVALLRKVAVPVACKDGIVKPNWDKEAIGALIERDARAVYRGLIVLFQRQTSDEQQSSDTRHPRCPFRHRPCPTVPQPRSA